MLVFGAALPFFPESPGYLIQKGSLESATISISFYYKCEKEEADKHVKEIQKEQMNSTKWVIGIV